MASKHSVWSWTAAEGDTGRGRIGRYQHREEPFLALPTLLWAWSHLSPPATAGNRAHLPTCRGTGGGSLLPVTWHTLPTHLQY